MALLTVGGKGFSLSPSSVYSFATSISGLQIDSSILDKISHSRSKKPSSKHSPSPVPPSEPSPPKTLTLEESRAALVVLLNKLLFADAAVRTALPLLIQETLKHGFPPESLDFASPLSLLSSIFKLKGKSLEEFGATEEEVGAVGSSSAAINGICALLDFNSSALVTVVDSVAALSSEAAKADAAAFDLPVSFDGFFHQG